MLRYQVMKTVENMNGTTEMIRVGEVSLPDNARGADQYLVLKRRGFKLQQLAYEAAEED